MSMLAFLKSLTSGSARRRSTRPTRAAKQLRVEALEDRRMPSAYSIVQIPLSPQDVNANGQVVGRTPSDPGQAALWQDGTLINLGSLAGPGGWSNAYAINDAGQVVGLTQVNSSSSPNAAFLITPEDTDQDGAPDRWYRDDDQDGANDLMTALPGSIAYDINSSGQVVGSTPSRGILWQNGNVFDLGPMVPSGINDAGQVVGTSSAGFAVLISPDDSNGDGRPDRWYRDTNSDGKNDLMVSLGQWGFPWGRGTAINDFGQVVGEDGYYSFLWTPSEPNGTGGTLEHIDLNYSEFNPSDINASGRVIGSYAWSYGGDEGGFAGSVAMLWENGELYNLADLLPAGSGWSELYSADAISDNGWIAGTAASSYYGSEWFVMIPTGDDIPPRIRIGDTSITEGNSGTRSATFTVTLSNPSSQTVTVAYATADYSARAGDDYRTASGTLTFAPGETSRTVTVLVNGDRLPEPNETFLVNLSGPTNAIIADGQGAGSIFEDEPHISITDVAMKEGKKGQKTLFTFTVSLAVAYDQPATVSFRTVGETATTGNNDYVAKSGTLTFAPGETSKTITIVVNGDGKREANEYFHLELFANSVNSWLAKSWGFGTILNDD